MIKRNAIIFYDEDEAMTILKPFSKEHENKVIIIHEDAYGEISLNIVKISEFQKKFFGSDEEFYEILKSL